MSSSEKSQASPNSLSHLMASGFSRDSECQEYSVLSSGTVGEAHSGGAGSGTRAVSVLASRSQGSSQDTNWEPGGLDHYLGQPPGWEDPTGRQAPQCGD